MAEKKPPEHMGIPPLKPYVREADEPAPKIPPAADMGDNEKGKKEGGR